MTEERQQKIVAKRTIEGPLPKKCGKPRWKNGSGDIKQIAEVGGLHV